MKSRLHISDVTLVMLGGDYAALTRAALGDIFDKFSFDRVMVFSHTPLNVEGNIVMQMSSVEDATRIAWREIYPRLETDFILSCHWDGYPIRPEMWMELYKAFDFIGPVWPWHSENSVGNTGFSLQSKRLLRALQQIEPTQPEDVAICRIQRPFLEKEFGIVYASEDIADCFGVEHGSASARPFGFHGLWNMLYFMDDETLMERLNLMTPAQWRREQVQMLFVRTIAAGRRDLYRWMRKRYEAMK